MLTFLAIVGGFTLGATITAIVINFILDFIYL